MKFVLDLVVLIVVAMGCWRGYRQQDSWLRKLGGRLMRFVRGHGFWGQWLRFGPLMVGWLLFCHWLNTQGWHASGAAGIVLAMTLGLDAMRVVEEEQKLRRS
ncbi:MAG: hypothetical protein D6703_02780 [Zetaproteobacteria bacterium]|nr:MAG: hypothetical protein D6703_02780 [Zetaproteobacteria bacterium]